MATVYGKAALFPGCVMLVSSLAIHCTGRIWGWWISDSYTTWIRNKIRKRCLDAKPSTDSLLKSSTYDASTAKKCDRRSPRAVFCTATLALLLGYLTVYLHSQALLRKAQYGWSTGTGICGVLYAERNSATAAVHPNMTSWSISAADTAEFSGQGYANTRSVNPASVYWSAALIVITDTSQLALRRMLWFVHTMVSGCFMGHVINKLMSRDGFAFLRAQYALLMVFVGGTNHSASHSSNPKKTDEYGQQETEESGLVWVDGQQNYMPASRLPTTEALCICTLWTEIHTLLFTNVRRWAFWLLLPVPAAQLLMPRKFQWQGILFILTGYTAWLTWRFVQSTWEVYRYCRKKWFREKGSRYGVRRVSVELTAWITLFVFDYCTTAYAPWITSFVKGQFANKTNQRLMVEA
ncbi:uncharacterized protein LOC129592963 [Paramacrobiotus metropolitanus]|uniref:uncharacterized protein LOC129592963 n=1 Tax=Paramacrobiotus metropolitanus TaxID=2943436 RepID=UPI002445FDD1|nr:uncharacterized protein LOC129592963 [Paramacrobiotus metropolitanus]